MKRGVVVALLLIAARVGAFEEFVIDDQSSIVQSLVGEVQFRPRNVYTETFTGTAGQELPTYNANWSQVLANTAQWEISGGGDTAVFNHASAAERSDSYKWAPGSTLSADTFVLFKVVALDTTGTDATEFHIGMRSSSTPGTVGYMVYFTEDATVIWATDVDWGNGTGFTAVDSVCDTGSGPTITAGDYVGVVVTGSGNATEVKIYDHGTTNPGTDPSDWAATPCVLGGDPSTPVNTAGNFILEIEEVTTGATDAEIDDLSWGDK